MGFQSSLAGIRQGEREEELPTARVERMVTPCSKLENTLGSHLLMGGSGQCLWTE